MTQQPSPAILQGAPDVLVIGAGVFGLSTARAAAEAGLSVTLVEAAQVGSGASGGVLGALMPHMPARWNAKKAFQFEALAGLEGHIARLEGETGLETGYRRCGRVLPITTADLLAHHNARAAEARTHWNTPATGFAYEIEEAGNHAAWLAPEAAPFGVVRETLAARISPRRYLQALAQAFSARGRLITGAPVARVSGSAPSVTLADGQVLSAGAVVLAQGFSSFAVLEALTGKPLGEGEKGQALRLAAPELSTMPAVYCDGLYVVPHGDGTVAIGSTAIAGRTDTEAEPGPAAALLARAIRFCPALAGRELVETWAGVRPKPFGRDPLVGRIPGFNRIFAATGGFKISFGIAHLVGAALAAELAGKEPEHPLPPTFRASAHFA
ncbi:FAD-dependent oxidoreductase [Pannonibacter sp. Pt2]|uniref:FAD-dependent oxidoreductase n=1 Tax=Pannonibacter anstelovis TaxID=3121537 RepID=A0ABU7ZK42_9HYPH